MTSRTSAKLSELSGGADVLLTTSCTHSLEMASMLAEVGPGDEVILPSFNFSSGATAIERFGATPVFVDIDPATKCVDHLAVRAAITPKTKAISWVNYAGSSPEISELKSLSKQFNLFLIEDNAHGLGGTYKGQPLGTFGDVSTLSFHSTKNVQCGEGGALVVNDRNLLDTAKIIREKGTNRTKFIEGAVHKYEWVGSGSSYLMAEVLSAILLGQLDIFDEIQADRVASWERYQAFFLSLNSEFFTPPPENFDRNKNVAHNYFLELKSETHRNSFIRILAKNGIEAAFHYQPLHLSPMGRKFSPFAEKLENTEMVARTLLRLPLYYGLQNSVWINLSVAVEEFLDSVRV